LYLIPAALNQAHRSAAIVPQRFEHPTMGLERTHSLMVIGAFGSNQISMLATPCLAFLTHIISLSSHVRRVPHNQTFGLAIVHFRQRAQADLAEYRAQAPGGLEIDDQFNLDGWTVSLRACT
jgi:hypothetical protein